MPTLVVVLVPKAGRGLAPLRAVATPAVDAANPPSCAAVPEVAAIPVLPRPPKLGKAAEVVVDASPPPSFKPPVVPAPKPPRVEVAGVVAVEGARASPPLDKAGVPPSENPVDAALPVAPPSFRANPVEELPRFNPPAAVDGPVFAVLLSPG